MLFYLLYWHDGFYLGPRFVVPLLPALVLWTARVPRIIADRVHSVHVRSGVVAALGFGVVGALVFNLPVRIASYRAGLTSMRVDYAEAAEQAGVRNSLVFVRESWERSSWRDSGRWESRVLARSRSTAASMPATSRWRLLHSNARECAVVLPRRARRAARARLRRGREEHADSPIPPNACVPMCRMPQSACGASRTTGQASCTSRHCVS